MRVRQRKEKHRTQKRGKWKTNKNCFERFECEADRLNIKKCLIAEFTSYLFFSFIFTQCDLPLMFAFDALCYTFCCCCCYFCFCFFSRLYFAYFFPFLLDSFCALIFAFKVVCCQTKWKIRLRLL